MKKKLHEHYFLSGFLYSDVACVKCGLNSRYIEWERFCKKKDNKNKYNKNFVTGSKLLNQYFMQRGRKWGQISYSKILTK
jgi:hypothetical protein